MISGCGGCAVLWRISEKKGGGREVDEPSPAAYVDMGPDTVPFGDAWFDGLGPVGSRQALRRCSGQAAIGKWRDLMSQVQSQEPTRLAFPHPLLLGLFARCPMHPDERHRFCIEFAIFE